MLFALHLGQFVSGLRLLKGLLDLLLGWSRIVRFVAFGPVCQLGLLDSLCTEPFDFLPEFANAPRRLLASIRLQSSAVDRHGPQSAKAKLPGDLNGCYQSLLDQSPVPLPKHRDGIVIGVMVRREAARRHMRVRRPLDLP